MPSDEHNQPLTLQEKVLYHQIHPAKLTADISASIISIYLLWQHELVWGICIAFAIAMIASAIIIRFVDLNWLKQSKAGHYIKSFMTRPIEAWRAGGQIVMWVGTLVSSTLDYCRWPSDSHRSLDVRHVS